jgi:hypothetical protein
MTLPAAFLLTILICLPIFGQTANPQQSSTQPQQAASAQETPNSNASSSSGNSKAPGVWRKIKVKVLTPPNGATAQCKDRTYSHSEHVSGTCANHGGVERWLRPVTLE